MSVKPLRESVTVSIAASGSGTATISRPGPEAWLVKEINITKGADITVDAMRLDQVTLDETAALDIAATYGEAASVSGHVQVDGSNAGTSAQDLTVEIVGVQTVGEH